MTKAVYETPTLSEIGTFETLTQGNTGGSRLDANFPAGTAPASLTFS